MSAAIRTFVILSIVTLIGQTDLFAQTTREEVIFKAMDDELNRSMSHLKINEFRPPFYISYQLADGQSFTVMATLGAITLSTWSPVNVQNVRLMVGDYSLSNENFVGSGFYSGGASLPLPLDNDYYAIRRSFWAATDQGYKRAINSYDQKLSALKQRNKSGEPIPDDFSKITPVSRVVNCSNLKYDKSRWEAVGREISAAFKAYTHISNSSVLLSFNNAIVYVTSSEGLKLKIPLSIACLWVNATLRGTDGEIFSEPLQYYALTPDELPSAERVKQDIKKMVDNISALSKSPVLTDAYSGPVIFEGEAVAELFIQKFFRNNTMVTSREPVYDIERQYQGNTNKMDDKINQRILAENITIKETPKLTVFNNTPLIGTFDIDSEGVEPQEELILVDKGILKTLLNDRIPTKKVMESNGHRRFALYGGFVSTQKAPGVINIQYHNGYSSDEVRTQALKKAEKDGLEYIYVIRKFEVSNPGQNRSLMMARSLPKPIGVYRLNVKSGEELLVRSALISEFEMTRFKYITFGTDEQVVYNTMLNNSVPVSFIVPRALVFEDISIEPDKTAKSKLPIVPNPLLSLHQK